MFDTESMIRLFDRTPSEPDASEKRRNGRYECDGVPTNLGQIVDMSATGVRLRCPARLKVKVGEGKWLSIRSAGGEIDASTVVRRVLRLNKREIEVALEFVEISEEAKKALYRVGQNLPPVTGHGVGGC